jgi:uncharacterized protein YcbK (DUF882 family)
MIASSVLRLSMAELVHISAPVLSRRRFLAGGLSAVLASFASPVLASFDQRSVSVVHAHTGEKLSAVYFKNGRYDQAACLRFAFALRDANCGDVHTIDPMLLDALFELQVRSGHDKPYQIMSGYRSPETNAKLREHSIAAAEHSHHINGKAVDIRVSGVPIRKLRDHALAMKRGGVGYYPNGGFIHVDTGRLRSW